MKINGIIHTQFDVESFDAITSLCQAIGVVDDEGTLVATLRNNQIEKRYLDEFGKTKIQVLYNQPFDVKYASTLIQLYELSCNYLKLEELIKSRTEPTEDYKTVNRLNLVKRN